MMAGCTAYVPALWLYEAVAVITKAQRTGKVSLYDADGFFDDLLSMDIVVDNQSAGLVFSEVRRLAAQHRLSGYDAAYLELAIRKGLPLATLDEELRQAAVSTGVVLLG
jgi:predicted nucleic acid-binding protein